MMQLGAISLQPSAPPVTISSPVPSDTITGCSVPSAGVTAVIAGAAGSQTVTFTASATAQLGTRNIACSTAAQNTLALTAHIETYADGITSIQTTQTGAGLYHISIYGFGFGDDGDVYLGGAATLNAVSWDNDQEVEIDIGVPDGVCSTTSIGLFPDGSEDPDGFAPAPLFTSVGLCPDVAAPPSPTAQIMMGSSVVSGNAANSPAIVSVGQQIVLTGSVNDLGGLTVVSQTWAVGGPTVKSYSPLDMTALNLAASPPICSASGATQLEGADFTQSAITFYWIDGYAGTGNLTNYTNNVTYTATLSDGSKKTAIAGFLPVKPSAITSTVEFSGATTTNVPAVSIAVGQNGTVTLGFGSSTQIPGIIFNMNVSTTIGGSFALLQLVNYADTYTPPNGIPSVSSSNSVFILDNGESEDGHPQYGGGDSVQALAAPSPPKAASQGTWQLNDSPGLGFTGYTAVSATQQFQTYLMYQPPSANSIWVTLQLLSWNWNGQSALTNGAWPIPTPFPPGVPTFSPNPSGSDSTALPSWKSCAKGKQ